ncbi:Protease HtpX [bioreactor metagenome]|uniref:Protease HtpX n=1 Tax=bioreactor metagenome TaxID=1076179 RepID=A0A644YIR0_9ZZZZ
MKDIPKLYIREGYNIDAYATCYSYPIVTLFTGAIDKMTDEELSFVIGHELGHIKGEHLLYKDVASKMSIISRIITDATFGFGGVVSTSLEVALLYWSRMAEYSCDRAGLLVCQNYDAAIHAIMKLAGGILVNDESISTDAFMEQVKEFVDYDQDSIDKVAKVFSVLDDTHPWTVMRAAELKKWVEDGSYKKTLSRNRNADILVCSVCGKTNKENSKFCSACGAKL